MFCDETTMSKLERDGQLLQKTNIPARANYFLGHPFDLAAGANSALVVRC